MVSVHIGVREVKESSSRMLNRVEAGLVAVYGWLSGPPMSDLDRPHKQLETIYQGNRIGF